MSQSNQLNHIPSVAVCGWSGSGKTWLLEKLVQRFSRQGYAVGVIKHDAHRLELDRPGKNTYRLWEAGTQSLLAHDESQVFTRFRKSGERSLDELMLLAGKESDFVLVEGHKFTHSPKLWLDHPEKPGIPNEVDNLIAHLPWGENRLEEAEKLIQQNLTVQWERLPINAGILTGGKSKRMGYPKYSMEVKGKPVIESIFNALSPKVNEVVLIGNHTEIPNTQNLKILPDIPDCEGPLAGMLSAFRWNPYSTWIIVACDMPNIQQDSVEWLLSQRKMGVWGVVPKDEDYLHPLFGVYEPGSFSIMEQAFCNNQFSVTKVIQHSKIKGEFIPANLQNHVLNCNLPEDLKDV